MFKWSIKGKLIAGFISIILFMIIIVILGEYSEEKNVYSKTAIIEAANLEIKMLECRREEKNIIIRGFVPEHIEKWNAAFGGIKGIINKMADKGYVSYHQGRMLYNETGKYEQTFHSFIHDFESKKVLTQEEMNAYDNEFKNIGRSILAMSERFITGLEEQERKINRENHIVLFCVFFAGVLFSIFLSYITIKFVQSSWDDLGKGKYYLESIIAAITDILVVIDKNNKIITVNPIALKFLGYSKEDLTGEGIENIFTEGDGPFAFTGMMKLTGEKFLDNYDVFCRTKDGGKIPVLLNYATIKDKSGGIVYVVCTAKDITEIKKIEEKLRTNEERYRNLVEMSPDLIGILDLGLNIIMINNVGVNYYGYDKEKDILGRNISEFLIVEQFSKAMESRERVLKTGVIRDEEFILKKKDGSLVFVELNANLVNDDEKNPKYIIIIVRDITRRKQAEKDLRKTFDKLKEFQLQFVQTEKMAAIGQLAGGVAHEINNPLTGVLNNAQLLKMLAAGKEKIEINEFKDLLNTIEESALRCKRITGSLLDFSRASAGKFENISVNIVINKVVSLVRHEMKLQNILLKEEMQPDIPNIQGDVQLLQQIIVNILSNSKWAVQKKFPKDSGGVIIIRSEYLLGGKYISIYIIDNGVGIPQDVINRIFEPFFTTKDIGEGTGLGLSIAFSIIEKHQGAIEVKSKINEGTTFKISLPVAG